MVRIFCLTSIIVKRELTFYNKPVNGNSNVDYLFPGDNTKEILKKLKNDPQVFGFYDLTEISIGHHFDGNEKIFLLLIFRKDAGLFVAKMIPGSVKFDEISTEVCQLSVSTSSLFSNIIYFELVIRIRFIKNTCVRGISILETKYYEKMVNDIKGICNGNLDLQESAFQNIIFELPKQSGTKVLKQKVKDIKTVVELLCDEITGNIENIPENARYNQRATCYRLTENTRNKVASRKRPSTVEMDDSNSPSETSCYSLEYNYLPSSETSDKRKKRGRPMTYSNEEERKKAKVNSSKKYIEHKEARYKQIQNELILLEKENQLLNERINEIRAKCRVKEKSIIDNLLNEKCIFEASINEKIHDMQISLPKIPDDVSSRTEKQRLLVQRCRIKKKAEKEILKKKYEFFKQQNESLKNQIENLKTSFQRCTADGIRSNTNEIEILKSEEPFDESDTQIRFQLEYPYPNPTSSSTQYSKTSSTYQQQPFPISSSYQPPFQHNNDINNHLLPNNDACSLYSILPKYANLRTHQTSNFANLHTLQLQYANVNEVCECFFEKLPESLTFLDLSNNNISFISKSISKLKNLKVVNFSKNLDLYSIPWESLSSNIEKLNLSDTSIKKVSALNLQKLKILDIQNTKLSALPFWFENLLQLQYLNLSNNKFDKNSNLEENLWKRLPPNISILKLCNNNLGHLPCLSKTKKFKYLSVNNCNLTRVCSYFLNQNRKSNMVLEIAGNWQLETLPIIPIKIIPPTLTKADTAENLYIKDLSVFTDNESFINTSRFPMASNKPIYELKEYGEKESCCCKCCGICGEPNERIIKQLLVMDFNLCLSINLEESKLNLFEDEKNNLEIKDILQQLIYKRKNKMHLVYTPSNWKTEITIGLCLKCLNNLKVKIYEAFNIIDNNKMVQKEENVLKAEPSSYFTEMNNIV